MHIRYSDANDYWEYLVSVGPEVWAQLPLNASILTAGTLAKTRQHAQTAYKDENNTFISVQKIGNGSSGNADLELSAGTATANGPILILDKGGTDKGYICLHSRLFGGTLDDMVLYTAATGIPLRLYSGGSECLNLLDGLVTLTTGQLKFPATQNPSTNANTLDDYEEGTWTPAWAGSGGQSGQVYSSQVGVYVKQGGWCFFAGNISLSTLGTITTNLQISGLPFTAHGSAGRATAHFGYFTGLTATVSRIAGYIPASGTLIGMTKIGGAGATGVSLMAQADLSASTDVIFSGAYRTAS